MTDEWTFDDIGPQRVYHYYEPKSGMRAVLAIDTMQFENSAGGIRMLPDISVAEVVLLARAMTYKYAWLDLNCAGSKVGIWFDPQTQDREAVLRAFGEAVAPLIQTRAFMGGVDMGTVEEDVELIYEAAGVKSEGGALSSRRVDGLTMDETDTINVAAHQGPVAFGDPEANVASVETSLEKAEAAACRDRKSVG